MTDDDIDIWFHIINKYMTAGDWNGLDNLLKWIGTINDELLGKDFLVIILTASLPAREKLVARERLYARGCTLYGVRLFDGLD
jgi:hypothetical protein